MYLRVAIGSYLRGRCVEYMGTLLWNLGYDEALRILPLTGVSIVCCADDTMLIACRNTPGSIVRCVEVGLALVASRVRSLGLELVPPKTEAMWFLDHSHRLRSCEGQLLARTLVRIGNVGIQVADGISLERMAANLGRPLSNLGDPDRRVRRLYAGIIRSMAMYKDPVWSDDLMVSNRSMQLLRNVWRRLNIRVIRGYRTVSYEVATALAGLPPLELLATADAYVYRQLRGCQNDSDLPELLREALRWVDRSHGRLTFRTTQVLTGHGCFGKYLCRIGREVTGICHHCDGLGDTAQHTPEWCQA
ncbi:uncharacterized protein LOC143431782 [Xylocopa sonorina]|uniref:uncharacterized protein LOC143431782 n=1 Tax=Xylocopa sonorina TaxID=1818115 RepID=UPI00403B3221